MLKNLIGIISIIMLISCDNLQKRNTIFFQQSINELIGNLSYFDIKQIPRKDSNGNEVKINKTDTTTFYIKLKSKIIYNNEYIISSKQINDFQIDNKYKQDLINLYKLNPIIYNLDYQIDLNNYKKYPLITNDINKNIVKIDFYNFYCNNKYASIIVNKWFDRKASITIIFIFKKKENKWVKIYSKIIRIS